MAFKSEQEQGSKPIRLADRMLVWLLLIVPHQLLSRWVFHITHWTWAPWKNSLISGFMKLYKIDLNEAENRDAKAFVSFNDFFTRRLIPSARPLASGDRVLVCPADGAVSQFGTIEQGQLIQAKGRAFSLLELVGGDTTLAERFDRGEFCTIYLSPRDYHRVHMPIQGRLRTMIHVPGRLFSVQDATAKLVDRLYARNERGVFIFDTEIGPVALIMVGAIFVSSINTSWSGVLNPHGQRGKRSEQAYPAEGESSVVLGRGEELGSFNMGSTVIMLFAENALEWSKAIKPGGKTRFGEEIALMSSAGS